MCYFAFGPNALRINGLHFLTVEAQKITLVKGKILTQKVQENSPRLFRLEQLAGFGTNGHLGFL